MYQRTEMKGRGIARWLAVPVAAVAAAVLVPPAGAASAVVTRVDPAAAMAACRQGVGAATTRVHVGPQDALDTVGMPGQPLQEQIRAGGVVRLRATGRISYGGVFNWRGTWGPGGNGRRAAGNFPYPGGPDAALFGIWNQTGTTFTIGSDSGCLWVPAATQWNAPSAVDLYTNDDYRADNGDAGYDVTVQAWLYYGRSGK